MHNPNTFDLNLLRIFDALMKEGSVSAAAARVGLSQPAASNALQRLRTLLGDPLFVRTRNGMEPTAFALKLGGPVLNGLAQIRSGLSQLRSFDPQTSSRVFTFLMNDVGAAAFLPAIVANLIREAPNVSVQVMERDYSEYEGILDGGEADLAVGRVVLADTFRSELLLSSLYVAVLRTDHPALQTDAFGKTHIDVKDYLAAGHVLVSPRGATANPVKRALDAERAGHRIVLEVPHAISVANILPATDLIATVPDRCTDLLCRDGRLNWVHVPVTIPPNLVFQWWHKRQEVDPGHVWLRDLVARSIRTGGEGDAKADLPASEAASPAARPAA